jgi:hypothetical protein
MAVKRNGEPGTDGSTPARSSDDARTVHHPCALEAFDCSHVEAIRFIVRSGADPNLRADLPWLALLAVLVPAEVRSPPHPVGA